MPAGGTIHSAPRAALGIMLTGITTGLGGAFPGLGQAGAGNARLAARSLSPPGWGELDKTMRSRRVPGSLAWSCAQRAKAPTARAVVERRQASASADRAPRASAEDGHIRLPAFRFLLLFAGSELKRDSFITWSAKSFVTVARFVTRIVVGKTRARMRRGKDFAYPPPRSETERGRMK